MVNLRSRADSIDIIDDEFGWLMQIDTEDGDCFVVRLPQDVAVNLATTRTQPIRDWLAEGYQAVVSGRIEAVRDWLGSEGAYEVSDPKHPRFEETMT